MLDIAKDAQQDTATEQDWLIDQGDEGWELQQVVTVYDETGTLDFYRYIFKRPHGFIQ